MTMKATWDGRFGWLAGVALVVALGWAPGQSTRLVTLQNGAVFEGVTVLESEHFIDLQMERGRIRLYRKWIATEEGTDGTPVGASQQPSLHRTDALPIVVIPPRRSLFPATLREGASHILPIHNLQRSTTRSGSKEEVALTFCRFFQDGKGADGLETLVKEDRLLEAAFPRLANGLTSYSRRLAARLFVRVLGTASIRPSVLQALAHAKLTSREMPGSKGVTLVEVAFHRGEGEPIVAVIGVADGHVVDLSQGPPPLPHVIHEIRAAVDALGGKAWQLVPVLERMVETEITRSLPGGDGSEPVTTSQVWSLRPKERRFIFTLPWIWEPVPEDESPSYADLMLHTQDGLCAAMAVTESGTVPLSHVKNSCLQQLKRTLGAFEMVEERDTVFHGTPAVQFRVRSLELERQLTFDFVLVVTHNRVYQFVAWCHSDEERAALPLMTAMLEGIRFVN
jgi:hypothetical protein